LLRIADVIMTSSKMPRSAAGIASKLSLCDTKNRKVVEKNSY